MECIVFLIFSYDPKEAGSVLGIQIVVLCSAVRLASCFLGPENKCVVGRIVFVTGREGGEEGDGTSKLQ